jgi:hypothetical protein
VSFLKEPPADTRVLLGYVKNVEHRAWIERTGLYNLRADNRRGSVNLDSRELAASVVLLYGEESDLISFHRVIDKPVLKALDAMLAIGYPGPRGTLYYCLAIEPLEVEEAAPRFSSGAIRKLVEQHQQTPVVGMPVVVSWAELLELPSVDRTHD